MENIKLINSIKNGFTAAEMAASLGIHDLDLYQHINKLEGSGYTLSRNYFSDGNFKYTFKANDSSNDKEINIITRPDEETVKVLCMSDLHYTSSLENNDMIHKAYDYAKRNGIKLIFLCGDILQGTFGHSDSTFLPGEEQIKRFLSDFPYDNDVLIFGVGGDHDESIYHREYLNPIDVITKARHNIVIPNYKYASLRIKDADITLKHIQSDSRAFGYPQVAVKAPENYDILVRGHQHNYEFQDLINKVNINIPTTSDIHSSLNGFVELTLRFNVNHLTRVEADFITYINGKEVRLVHNVGNVNFKEKTVNNIQDFKHKKINNPFKPTLTVDNSEEINTLKKHISDANNKLAKQIIENETLEAEKNDLIEENCFLTSTIERLESDKSRLEESLKSAKYDKSTKSSKIEELESENKRVFDSNRQLTTNNKELKSKNQELIKELNEYKRQLKEALEGKTIVVPVEETTITVVEQPVEVVEVDINSKEYFYKTFKEARMEEFRKFLKSQTEKEEKDRLREEFLKKAHDFKEELTYEDVENNEELADKMCEVMDAASFALSGVEQRKKILKTNKVIAKGKRMVNSQMSRQDRIQELMNKKKNK